MSHHKLSQKIKNLALELGFSKIGITPAAYHSQDDEYLQTWIDKGRHATMDWVVRRKDERANIFEYYPQAKSVIVVGLNYYTGLSPKEDGIARFSNYAWGDDYHDLLKKKLYHLLGQLKSIDENLDGIACVDTSPVTEKAWAQRAGLGWIGKHTNLLTRDYSSWLFLGVLIINQELDYDKPYEDDMCGSCTACIDDCPTDALVDAYQLDANKCISYLTIEHRGDIPEEFHDKLNNWIYGCDICQEVCPWSQKYSQVTKDPAFRPRSNINERSFEDWEKLTEEDFRVLFKKSAVKRTKYTGLKRNITLLDKSTSKSSN
ncbi:MAG: tRNA epoxyqueuosine(34) reductase QueG [Candidatus Marinimicrobia bacterium]|nr:tRNA epoxyqueuosine(34) reductase QueG [Candidatus Neomarinimicrobiota bacterium]